MWSSSLLFALEVRGLNLGDIKNLFSSFKFLALEKEKYFAIQTTEEINNDVNNSWMASLDQCQQQMDGNPGLMSPSVGWATLGRCQQ